ncbi:MAG: SCO family protein [Alphaproteobacteria bacterium]|nr:MAG: SCO family protein [Alphaproteobacteria bacterium]
MKEHRTWRSVLAAIILLGVALLVGRDQVILVNKMEETERTFVSTDGHFVTAEQLKGRYFLVLMSGQTCKAECQTALHTMSDVVAKANAPAHISAEALHITLAIPTRSYDAMAQTVSMTGMTGVRRLTGSASAMRHLTRKWGVPCELESEASNDIPPTIHLIGPEGKLRDTFSHVTPTSVLLARLDALANKTSP